MSQQHDTDITKNNVGQEVTQKCAAGKAISTLTKKRYLEIKQRLLNNNIDPEAISFVMTSIEEVCKFDPTANGYTPQHNERCKRYYQKKQQETGLSTYAILKHKQYYDANKESVIEKIIANRKKKST